MAMIAGVYLMIKTGGWYYVGQTKRLNHRYGPKERGNILLFIEVNDTKERLEVEREAIEFCDAFGLPLCNDHRNSFHGLRVYSKRGYNEPTKPEPGAARTAHDTGL